MGCRGLSINMRAIPLIENKISNRSPARVRWFFPAFLGSLNARNIRKEPASLANGRWLLKSEIATSSRHAAVARRAHRVRANG